MPRSLESIYEEWLVLRSQDGEVAALKELVERWQPRLLRHAWRLSGDREAARDVAQSAWLAIVRGIRGLGDPARFGPWAYRIVTNKCADRVRRLQRQRKMTDAVAHQRREAGDSGQTADDSADELRCALRRLTGDRRALLALHYVDGLTLPEIARALDVPLGTVKSRLHHARNELRGALERKDHE